MHGQHMIKSWSSTQALIALSSGEAEYYGLVKAAGAGLGVPDGGPKLAVAGARMDRLERGNWHRIKIRAREVETPGDTHLVAPGEGEDRRDLGEEGSWGGQPRGPIH